MRTTMGLRSAVFKFKRFVFADVQRRPFFALRQAVRRSPRPAAERVPPIVAGAIGSAVA